MIEVKNISKSYGSTKALDDISLNISKGSLFGLIGPDGAGKSTLFRILTTLLIPDEGTATLLGYDTVIDYKKIRQIVGYMPGRFSLYLDLSVQENLEFFAKVFNTTIEANYDMIHEIYVMLEPFKDRKASDLSGGMKQKLALCCALIHKPEILLLDEPTFGVDPVSRKEFWDNLKKLQKKDNLTTLVSTPYMDEAAMCDDIALIQNGEILTVNTPQNICDNFGNTLFELRTNNNYKAQLLIKDLQEVNTAFMFGNSIHITMHNNNISDVEQTLVNNKFEFSVKVIKANIEDSFMELMTKKL